MQTTDYHARYLAHELKKYFAHTQHFEPTADEDALYNLLSEYLRQENLQALPKGQHNLMILIIRKLPASSSFAIAGAQHALAQRKIKEMEKRRSDIRRNLFDEQDQIDQHKDDLLETVEARMAQETTTEIVFAIQWKLNNHPLKQVG